MIDNVVHYTRAEQATRLARMVIAHGSDITGTVIDLCCGEGALIVAMIDEIRSLGLSPPKRIVLVDSDARALAICTELVRERFSGEIVSVQCDALLQHAMLISSYIGASLVLCNPPFAGKHRLSSELSEQHRESITRLGVAKSADLAASFIVIACRMSCIVGSVEPMNLSKGLSRRAIERAVHSHRIIDERIEEWSGDASVFVGLRIRAANGVSIHRAPPSKLISNAASSFLGVIIYGEGFTLTPEERDALVRSSKKNAQRIKPYLGGKEVNTSPTQMYDRYVIDFGDLSLEEAEAWPELLAIVLEKVKPERDLNNRKVYRDKWWQYGERRPAMYTALKPLSRCLVNSQVTKHLCFASQPTDRIFSHALYAYPLPNPTAFAILQSRVHEVWARLWSSTMKGDLRYNPSYCYETFPFPNPDPRQVLPALEALGAELESTRASYLVQTNQGLTKCYNQLKDSSNQSSALNRLRELHREIDIAVLSAYGWDDITVPEYDGYVDYSTQPWAEIIDRLYELNANRSREEKCKLNC